MSSRWAGWLRFVLTVVLAVGVGIALAEASSRARSVDWPALGAIATGLLLVALAQVCGSIGWIVLYERSGRRVELAWAHLVGQLGKYVPGGLVQLATQADLARRAGVAGRTVAAIIPIHALVVTVAPGVAAAAALGAVDGHLPGAVRAALVVGGAAGAATLVQRGWLARGLDVIGRRWSRLPNGDQVPTRRALVVAAGWGMAALACYGSAMAVLLAPSGGVRPFALVAAGGVVAFTVGFLALPFPAGLGVREALLVVVLRPVAPTADVLAAAVMLRIVQLAAELVLVTLVWMARRRLLGHERAPAVGRFGRSQGLADGPGHGDGEPQRPRRV